MDQIPCKMFKPITAARIAPTSILHQSHITLELYWQTVDTLLRNTTARSIPPAMLLVGASAVCNEVQSTRATFLVSVFIFLGLLPARSASKNRARCAHGRKILIAGAEAGTAVAAAGAAALPPAAAPPPAALTADGVAPVTPVSKRRACSRQWGRKEA